MPPFFTLISMRATRRSSSETIRSSAREECNHAGAPPRPAHVRVLSADAPRRGLTRRDCGRLRLNQTRRPRPARTDRVERPRDSPIRAERRVPITRRTRRFACPRGRSGAGNFREHSALRAAFAVPYIDRRAVSTTLASSWPVPWGWRLSGSSSSPPLPTAATWLPPTGACRSRSPPCRF